VCVGKTKKAHADHLIRAGLKMRRRPQNDKIRDRNRLPPSCLPTVEPAGSDSLLRWILRILAHTGSIRTKHPRSRTIETTRRLGAASANSPTQLDQLLSLNRIDVPE
jgi:hypothetical protein